MQEVQSRSQIFIMFLAYCLARVSVCCLSQIFV